MPTTLQFRAPARMPVMVAVGLATGLLLSMADRIEGQACLRAGPGPDAQVCLEEEVGALRLELEGLVDEYASTLDAPYARDLHRAQDEWERYVERECDLAAERYGVDELQIVELFACLERSYRQRTFQVQLLLAARRGGEFIQDPTCFVPDSDLVRLRGWITDRFYAEGATPDYDRGRHPDPVLVLTLDEPLCLNLGNGPREQTAVQLVGLGRALSRQAGRMLGRQVEILGRLYLAEARWHRTPIVLLVHEVESR